MLDPTVLIAFVDEKPEPKDANANEPQGLNPLVLFVPIAIMFYLLVLRPGSKERQKRVEMLGTLKKDDEVVTSAGIIGRVANIKDKEDEVTIKSDETRIRVLKSSIVRIVTAKEEPPKEQPKA